MATRTLVRWLWSGDPRWPAHRALRARTRGREHGRASAEPWLRLGAAIFAEVQMSDERANTCGLTLCAKGRGRFAAIAEDGRLLAESHTPIFEAARVLQAQGVPGDTVLEVRQEGSPIISMRVTVAMAPALTVEEGPSGPRFRPHRPPPE